eukprot:554876-Rhodomonas_salina.2
MSGTDLVAQCDVRYHHSVFLSRYAMSGTDLAYAATAELHLGKSLSQVGCAISLRACYAMSGTDLAFGARYDQSCTRYAWLSPYALATR